MKLIVGLGNPGVEYQGTRHNIGFCVADALARRLRAEDLGRKWYGLATRASRSGSDIYILKPQTYMNASGRAVSAAVSQLGIALSEILVISDELALPLGTLRFRPQGTSGGQKGLQSIIEALGDISFPRLRVGIGTDTELLPRDFVLQSFASGEEQIVEETVIRAVKGVEFWIARGIELTMARFNRVLPDKP